MAGHDRSPQSCAVSLDQWSVNAASTAARDFTIVARPGVPDTNNDGVSVPSKISQEIF